MSTTAEKLALAEKFHAALVAADWAGMRALFTADVTWTLPGENTVSGTASGPDEVIERARKIAGYGLTFTFERTLISRDNLALSLHNTANRDGRVLDEHLATVCRLRGNRIAEIETYLSDVDGMNAFFV